MFQVRVSVTFSEKNSVNGCWTLKIDTGPAASHPATGYDSDPKSGFKSGLLGLLGLLKNENVSGGPGGSKSLVV